jgi:hypothetical protein
VISLEDVKCLVHLSASKTDEIVGGMKELVLKNSTLGLYGVADMLGILFLISSEHFERRARHVSDRLQIHAPPVE